jgi:hypothetical protein
VEGLDQRAVVALEAAAGAILEPGRDFECVAGTPGKGLENEEVEGALRTAKG